ncbi:hypothetical protein [Micromonospora tulbaghiae]|uniref:hypothetical protein n=1 Tax=Micromonospora tulbaghiae TaxID=479978 RepID=UPI0033E29CD4
MSMKTAEFPTATIVTDEGTVIVPCEPINDWLAITPATGRTDDGRYVLGGTFTITHLPTGATIADGDACINCCRASARKIGSLATADWSTLTADNTSEWSAALSEQDRETLALYRALEWGCDADLCQWPTEDGTR